MALSVLFDHAQKRLQWDRLSASAIGALWDGSYWSNTWLDPITKTLMLRPGPLYQPWETSNSGIYAKYAWASTAQNDSSKWTKGVTRGVIEYWTTQTTNEWIRGSSALGINRPVWLSVMNHTEGGVALQAYAGWSNSSAYDDAEGVGLLIYTDGTVHVYRYGSFVGSGRVTSGGRDNTYLDLLLIPMRRRELLVINPVTYSGFSVVFSDIAEDETAPVITPAKKFFAKNPAGTLQCHFSPVVFETSGYATSSIVSFTEAPTVSDTLETWTMETWLGGAARPYRLTGDHAFEGALGATSCTASATLVKTNNAAWAADGVIKQCRLKVTLGGPGTHTPFIYGAHIAFAPIYVDTDDAEEYEALPDLHSCRLSVPDSGTDTTVELEVFRLEAFEANVAAARSQCNRPVKVSLGASQLVNGRSDAPSWVYDWNDENKSLHMTVRDVFKALDAYRFQDVMPLDGFNLATALTFLIRLPLGSAYSVSIETTSFELPKQPTSSGDWNVLIEAGDTAGDWVRRLIEDYAATWLMAVLPDGTIKIKPEESLSATPDITLYPSAQDAIDDGVDAEDADGLLYWSYHEQIVEPEGNDVWATGQDPRDMRPLQSHKVDDAARDPTTVPSSRPENWMGEYRRVGLMSPALTRQDDTDFAAETLYDRVTPLTKIGDFSCNLPVLESGKPLWRLDRVRLFGLGQYRVLSLDCDFNLETTGYTHREARYVAKFLEPEEEE